MAQPKGAAADAVKCFRFFEPSCPARLILFVGVTSGEWRCTSPFVDGLNMQGENT